MSNPDEPTLLSRKKYLFKTVLNSIQKDPSSWETVETISSSILIENRKIDSRLKCKPFKSRFFLISGSSKMSLKFTKFQSLRLYLVLKGFVRKERKREIKKEEEKALNKFYEKVMRQGDGS